MEITNHPIAAQNTIHKINDITRPGEEGDHQRIASREENQNQAPHQTASKKKLHKSVNYQSNER